MVTITFSTVELAALEAARRGEETIEGVIHRLLDPLVDKYSDGLLQTLANQYRQLAPEKRLEAVALLKEWAARQV